ncbi:uncharacterized protein LOC126372695 [Pectinophora gossypiella]|uniref:uncharacterized protein LOC126372695 n=1 Tax=Pectinophora gossypiella TaxID=13191 RepID=UPI00214F30AA|nr:uncharacterized protein LOC126372695 [Pectinophora gossypiella]
MHVTIRSFMTKAPPRLALLPPCLANKRAELFHNVYDGQRLNLGPGLPVALHSVFGWVLTGKLDPECRPPPTTSSLFASTLALDNVVKRFWEVEEPPSVDISNPEDDKCEQLYTNLVKRNPDGRYVVPMLVKEPCEKLGDSYNISLSRFTNLERRLHRHDQLKEDYVRFMREYSELGHMEPVDPPNDSDRNIIPHHCVLRPDSSTTKLRVVFDGSARTTNGKALNDIVHTGPKLQNDIVDIITKFRLHEVVFTADISKMYRNIDLRPEDLGAPSVEEAIELKNELVKLLDCAKFELRKWSSNSPEFLSQLPSEHCQIPKPFCDNSNQHTLKILGIQWDPTQDNFTYSASELDSKCTKRSILSNVARIYDPLGWLTPVVLIAKLLIQDLWRRQLDWDESVPADVSQQWQNFVSELQNLTEVRIPRRVALSNTAKYELVGFCDGSTKAYGCCVYQRSIGDGDITSHLLIAKSRVAPLKPLTVNRLELCGAALLARVLKHMYSLLHSQINIVRVTAFTDSSTVLAWLNTPPYKLKTFVSHRVAKIIDEVSVENWLHVSTHDNPADHCSRGLPCSQIITSQTWWSGPKWLLAESTSWPIQRELVSPDNIPELKSTAHVALPTSEKDDAVSQLIHKCSSLSRVQRVLAWCLRFVANSKRSSEARITSPLTVEELNTSLSMLARHEQAASFSEEIDSVKSNIPCSRIIQKLYPFIDELGLLRVGGRLKNSQLPQNTIHPILLPKLSPISRLIIDYYHRLHLHCGPRTLQSLVQRRFWILGIRNLIRSRLSKCVTCFKVNPTPCQPMMGNLPSPRVQPARCFQNVGVDFAGPFTVKESRRRNAKTYKAYVCVIVCLAVKAIHLEVVSDLSTPAFIAAFDRFVSRRGLCKMVISDCGTNFIGARRYLSEIHQLLLTKQSELNTEFSGRGIDWRLNPPTGSHFGGIFESGVKSMKHHLKRVVGLQVLTFEELVTVLTKIEAVLNSRPLCFLSSDPSEVDVLTPGHFLTGGPLVSLPEPQLEDTYVPPRERWQMLQKLTQSFWRAWQRDYLHTLQQRVKWFKGQANVKIGNIVTIVEQNLPPLEWHYGKVVDIHPGNDGVVRVVTLRTAKGLLRRPVAKICPLPLSN